MLPAGKEKGEIAFGLGCNPSVLTLCVNPSPFSFDEC